MSDLRRDLLKLARETPELRKHLVPVLRKTAGDFTETEWKKHKQDHPGADPADHNITPDKKPGSGVDQGHKEFTSTMGGTVDKLLGIGDGERTPAKDKEFFGLIRKTRQDISKFLEGKPDNRAYSAVKAFREKSLPIMTSTDKRLKGEVQDPRKVKESFEADVYRFRIGLEDCMRQIKHMV